MNLDSTLEKQLNNKHNSIGFLRLSSAIAVIVGHSFAYGGLGQDPLAILTHNQMATGRWPVDLFFALSGYLITASYLRSNSLGVFLWHRFLRIYPAFWVCLVVTAFVVTALFDLAPNLTYIKKNFLLIGGQYNYIKGLFTNKPGGTNVNSSLWTLPLECWAYLAVATLGLSGLLKKRAVVLATFALVWAWFGYILLTNPLSDSNATIGRWPRLFTFFFCGATFYGYRDRIVISQIYFLSALAGLVGIVLLGNYLHGLGVNLFYLASPVLFTYVVFYLSIKLPFQTVNVKNDISYGIYIYGTLVLNILSAKHVTNSYWVYLGLTLAITLVLSTLSWHLIEKPALQLKDVFRKKPARPVLTNETTPS